MARQLLMSSWLSEAKHIPLWAPVAGEAGVFFVSMSQRDFSGNTSTTSCVWCPWTPTWLSKRFSSVRLFQEIPSLLKPILTQSIVSNPGSNQVSEIVFPQITRERKECEWGFRAPPRGCCPGLRVVRVSTSLYGIQRPTTLSPIYLHL